MDREMELAAAIKTEVRKQIRPMKDGMRGGMSIHITDENKLMMNTAITLVCTMLDAVADMAVMTTLKAVIADEIKNN